MLGVILAVTIRVSAAASLSDALQAIVSRYHAASVVFNFGASGLLARQIMEGAPADIFISADEPSMDRLEQRGLIVAGSRRKILSNRLVVIVPADSRLRIASPRDLLSVRRVAIASPDNAPAGAYAKEYLRRVGVWDRIAPRVIPTANVRSALAAVESGDVDAGIVYKTDALISRAVRIAYEVPQAEGPTISYPAAVIAHSHEKAAALRFLDYLQSAQAREIFRKAGFVLP